MALVICEDCGRDISDLSDACVHCGRPLQKSPPPLGGKGEPDDQVSRMRKLGGQARDRARQVASGAKRAFPLWANRAKGALPDIRKIPRKTIEKLIQDRDLDVLLLPTGSNPDEFICTVDLTETLEALSAGILARPRLVIWAHRSDIDQDRLAFLLEEQFSDQVSAFKAAKVADHEETAQNGIEKAEEDRKDAKRVGRTSTKALLASLLGMALVTNPLVDVILLVVAVTSGVGVFVEGIRELGAEVELSFARSRHKAGAMEGSRAAEAKKRAFRKALKRWKVRVHPQLFTLASDFAVLDDSPEPRAEEVEKAGPRLVPVLENTGYMKSLPDWYHPLVERRLETWGMAEEP